MNAISTVVAPEGTEPTPDMVRLTARIRNAAEEVQPGRFLISSRSAPTAAERRALTRRADELRACLTPAEAEDIAREALKLMAGYPSLRLTHEEAARTAAMFVAALAGLPLWAIRRACMDWATGRTRGSNPAFPPSAPELRIAADRVAQPRQHEAGLIYVALSAETEQAPTQAERERAIAHWYETVRPTLQHADVSDSLSPEAKRAEQIEANDRLRRHEREAAGADPEGNHTIEMEDKLARMRRHIGLDDDC